jgi:hypothetical protein
MATPLFQGPVAIPTGQEVEACAIAICAVMGIIFHTAEPETRERARLFASACLARIGAEDRKALGDRRLMAQLEGIAEAAEAAVRALDAAPDHTIPEPVVQNLQRAATVARTFHELVLQADLPEFVALAPGAALDEALDAARHRHEAPALPEARQDLHEPTVGDRPASDVVDDLKRGLSAFMGEPEDEVVV